MTFFTRRKPALKASFSLRECDGHFHFFPISQNQQFDDVADLAVFEIILDGMLAVEPFSVEREDEVLFMETGDGGGGAGNDAGIARTFVRDERAVAIRNRQV